MLFKQLPIPQNAAQKGEMRTQFGALCYRETRGRPEILLITSRRTRRWIVPKGWPEGGQTPAATAAQEAWEEAGVVGRADNMCMGVFSYNKLVDDGSEVPCLVMLYPFRVKSLANAYPEKSERRRKWFTPKKAACRVLEPELAEMLRSFNPAKLSLSG